MREGSAPDSRTINARKGDIAAFFNAGGGIYVNSGASHADGNAGWPTQAPFDAILVTAGGRISDTLLEQLGEGASLVAPIDAGFHRDTDRLVGIGDPGIVNRRKLALDVKAGPPKRQIVRFRIQTRDAVDTLVIGNSMRRYGSRRNLSPPEINRPQDPRIPTVYGGNGKDVDSGYRRAAFVDDAASDRRGGREVQAQPLDALPEHVLADRSRDPAQRALLLERQAALRAAVAALADPYREVVALRFFGELSLEEISRATGRPLNTVKTHLRRGLERLRPMVGEPDVREAEA